MPTGYTAAVQSGEVTEFPVFAMQCARNFGALVMMRDEPMGASIPDEFQPSSHHADALKAAFAELAELRMISEDEADKRAKAMFTKQVQDRNEYRARKAEDKLRYVSMLNKVLEWEPPSVHHVELKKFMVDQITDSIRWDCHEHEGEVVELNGRAWLDSQLKRVNRDIEYHKAENAKELERTQQRNEWVKQLRDSLAS